MQNPMLCYDDTLSRLDACDRCGEPQPLDALVRTRDSQLVCVVCDEDYWELQDEGNAAPSLTPHQQEIERQLHRR